MTDEIPRPDTFDAVRQRGDVARSGAELQLGDRERDGDQDGGCRNRGEYRPVCRGSNDRAPDTAPLAAVAGENRDAETDDPAVEDGERRGQESEAAQDRDQDDRDRTDGDRLEDVVVDQEQSAERDHDRQAAEEDGPAGSRTGDFDRTDLAAALPVLLAQLGSDRLPVTGEDAAQHAEGADRAAAAFGAEARYHEERIVDRDREADQNDDLARVLAYRGDELAVYPDQPHGAGNRAHCEHERHQGGHERPRRDEQDQEGDEQRREKQRIEAVVDVVAEVGIDEAVVEGVQSKARV